MRKKLSYLFAAFTIGSITSLNSSAEYVDSNGESTTEFLCPPAENVNFDARTYNSEEWTWEIELSPGMPLTWQKLLVRADEDDNVGAGSLSESQVPHLIARRLYKSSFSHSIADPVQCNYDTYNGPDDDRLILTPKFPFVPGSSDLHYPVKAASGAWFTNTRGHKDCLKPECSFTLAKLSIRTNIKLNSYTTAHEPPVIFLENLIDENYSPFDLKVPVSSESQYHFPASDKVTADVLTRLVFVQPNGITHELSMIPGMERFQANCNITRTTLCNSEGKKPDDYQCTERNIRNKVNSGVSVILDITGEYDVLNEDDLSKLDCTVYTVSSES